MKYKILNIFLVGISFIGVKTFAIQNPLTILGLTPGATLHDVFDSYSQFESRYTMLQIMGIDVPYDKVVLEKATQAFELINTQEELEDFVLNQYPNWPKKSARETWKILDFAELVYFINDRTNELSRGYLIPRKSAQSFFNQLSVLKYTFLSLVKSRPESFSPPGAWHPLPDLVPEKIDALSFYAAKQFLDNGESLKFIVQLFRNSDLSFSRRSVSFIGFLLEQKLPTDFEKFQALKLMLEPVLGDDNAWNAYFTHKSNQFPAFVKNLSHSDLSWALANINGRTNFITLLNESLNRASTVKDFLDLLQNTPRPLSNIGVEMRLANGIDTTAEEYAVKLKKMAIEFYPKFSSLQPTASEYQNFILLTGAQPISLKLKKAKVTCINLLSQMSSSLFRR
jgi:hypothetical protein